MSRPVAWSYSALSMFETCPRQYYEVRIRKSVKQENYANSAGAKKHKEIELYLINDTPVCSPEIANSIAVVDHFKHMSGRLYTEHQMALDMTHRPVDYKDWNNAWVRAVADALVVDSYKATIADWKFGKPRDGDDQIKLSAAVTMSSFPRVDRVEGVYVYFEHKIVSPTYVYERKDLTDIWAEYGRRYSVLQSTTEKGSPAAWVPKPSGLCSKWCPVTTCEFNGGFVG